jgi:hypothetical protein
LEDFGEAIAEYMVNWGYFWSPIRLGAVYWIASHQCAFSVVQSIFLTVLWAFGVEVRHLSRVAAKQFVPFSFSIRPNYRTILTDAGLLANGPEGNERDWATLIEGQAVGKSSWSGNETIPWSGTQCHVIDYNADSDRHVIAYKYSYASFANPHPQESERYLNSSVLGFHFGRFELERLPLAGAFPADCRGAGSSLKAGFWAEPRGAGLHILMDIDDKWWAARWADSTDAKPVFLREDVDSWEGRVELTVAVIPYVELQCFYHWIPRRGIVSLRHRDRVMKSLGWHADPIDKGAADYSHKYLDFHHGPSDHR